MIFRDGAMSRPEPKPSAAIPTRGIAWVYLQGTVDEGDSRIDVFARRGERMGGDCQSSWVFGSSPNCSLSKINDALAIRLGTHSSLHFVATRG